MLGFGRIASPFFADLRFQITGEGVSQRDLKNVAEDFRKKLLLAHVLKHLLLR
jgi:hypothetical protein